MVYKWKEGSRFKVSANVAGAALEEIRSRHGGLAPAPVVFDESKPVDAPLHRCFEWDEQKASRKWNIHLARQIIHSVIEVHYQGENKEPIETRAYTSVRDPELGRGYQTNVRVMSQPELRDQAIRDVLALLRGVEKRFAHLSGLEEVFAAIARAAAEIEAKQKNDVVKRSKKATPRPAEVRT